VRIYEYGGGSFGVCLELKTKSVNNFFNDAGTIGQNLVGLGRLLVCVAFPCDLSVFVLAFIIAKDLSFGAWTS
jgi:hypothetical protein